ncbi:MAG TPA: patatin-like phospholipase family protein [Streptosporangiaceae bacterium]|nr:patatin-like phospholipase family protein [Streptosporangiaceae bacterium]
MVAKALVLGGGGVTGIAWEIGILAGLAEQGLDLADADVVIGTSAGSVVGVDVRSGAADVRRRVIESRLPTFEWPAGQLKITAVDAATGRFAIFDSASGVRLVDAVGASCAVPGTWPPVTIDGRRYIDGGMRSAANADLAAGCERIVVIAPLVQGFGNLESVASQVRRLGEQGAQVTVIKPDKAAVAAIGRNVLDPAHRPEAARAGFTQAASEAADIRAVWSGS